MTQQEIPPALTWIGDVRSGALTVRPPTVEKDYVQVCSKCIYDSRIPGLTFDREGICTLCHQVEALADSYGTGTPAGEASLEAKLKKLRKDGAGKQFDCIIGVSGGTDSSYLIRMAKKEWGLRPLAVHYDNTWNSGVAAQNIAAILNTYNVPLHTHVVNHEVADRIFRSFFLVGVPELEASTDLAFSYLLRTVARKYKVGYVLEGHSFVAEGVTPLTNNYFDGRYIRSVVDSAERAGLVGPKPEVSKKNSYPLMTMSKFLVSVLATKTVFLRPFWYLDYEKGSAKDALQAESEWRDYGGHHLENRMTAFFHSVYMPRRFGIDFRNNSLAAQARQGILTRQEAWRRYCCEPHIEEGLEDYFRKRLNLSHLQYENAMRSPLRRWNEFKTYKRRFEILEPMFRFLVERERVTRSFYNKYCF